MYVFTLLIWCLFAISTPLFISPRVPRSWSDGFPVRRISIEECITAMKRCSTSETTAPVCQKEAPPPLLPRPVTVCRCVTLLGWTLCESAAPHSCIISPRRSLSCGEEDGIRSLAAGLEDFMFLREEPSWMRMWQFLREGLSPYTCTANCAR